MNESLPINCTNNFYPHPRSPFYSNCYYSGLTEQAALPGKGPEAVSATNALKVCLDVQNLEDYYFILMLLYSVFNGALGIPDLLLH